MVQSYARCVGSYSAELRVRDRARLASDDRLVPADVQRTGQTAKLAFAVHPHMLRHACGYKLTNDGHDTRSLARYLGHRNLQSTARYTALAPDRFARFWQD